MKSTKSLVIVLVVFSLTLALSGVAYAITYGVPDGDGHPYVGMITFYDESGQYMWRCTGTLIDPQVVLTAGHCTSGPASARVWFEADLNMLQRPYPDCGGYPCVTGVPHPHSAYDGVSFPNTYDVGVIVLDEPVTGRGLGALPELGVLDGLATQRGHQDLVFRSVGYGQQSVKPGYQADKIRYTSTSLLVNLRSHLTDGYNLHTSNNPGEGHGTSGGSCFGDSGGPVFYPENSNVVVGIVSFGMNSNCKGADWSYRADTAITQDFVSQYLP